MQIVFWVIFIKVKKNINQVIHYYSLAANQYNPIAQFNLGIFYSDGIYTSINFNKAIHYYSLAANQHFAPAYYRLAHIYLQRNPPEIINVLQILILK